MLFYGTIYLAGDSSLNHTTHSNSTVDVNNLKKHLAKCNAKPLLCTSSYFSKDVNVQVQQYGTVIKSRQLIDLPIATLKEFLSRIRSWSNQVVCEKVDSRILTHSSMEDRL